MTRSHRTPGALHPGGFSLIELISAIAVTSVLFGSIAASIMLAARAMPTGESVASVSFKSANIADRLVAELQTAVEVNAASPTMIDFDVVRNGTTRNRYEWGGTGTSLTRTYDGRTPSVLLESPAAFSLEYDTQENDATPHPEIESPEQLFLAYDSNAPGAGSGGQVSITDTAEYAECFQPTLPIDANSWRITMVQFVASPKKPSTGAFSVSVAGTEADRTPSPVHVDTVLVAESSLTNNSWHEVTFPDASGLDVDAESCIVFGHSSGSGTVAMLKVNFGSTGTPETTYLENYAQWVQSVDTDIRLFIWGTVSILDPDWVPPASGRLMSVSITIDSAGDIPGAVHARALTLNQPDY